MELREIEIFLVLADELHFGRTAERLFLSSSRISQTVRALETSVGGRLFDRTSRQVRLTPLGEQLRDRLRPAHEQLHAAFAAVREMATGITGELRLSMLTFATGGPWFADIVSAFETAHPGCKVTVYEAFPGEALNRLRRDELDIVAHWLPLSQPDLTVGPVLGSENRVLAVHTGHPLAERGWATLEDLADNQVIDASDMLPPETLEVLYPARTPAGRTIRRTHREGRMVEVLSLVSRGAIVHPTVASLSRYYSYPNVTTIPLRDVPPVRSALVWATDKPNAAVRAFVETAAATLANHPIQQDAPF